MLSADLAAFAGLQAIPFRRGFAALPHLSASGGGQSQISRMTRAVEQFDLCRHVGSVGIGAEFSIDSPDAGPRKR